MTTYTLRSPVEHAGTVYETLTFREAETGDLMAMDAFKGETSKAVALLAAISETPLPAFKKIKARDLTAIMAATGDLLGEPEAATNGE